MGVPGRKPHSRETDSAQGEAVDTLAIVITYQPEPVLLAHVLVAIAAQVGGVVVVDNASTDTLVDSMAGCLPLGAELIRRDRNGGIASAINLGLAVARERGVRQVILFDQDSVPEPDMVARLLDVLRGQQSQGCQVAAVGPRFVDPQGQLEPAFVRLQGLRLCRIPCAEQATEPVEVDHLISSGCLIDMAALNSVGDMEECLFIDYVDTEWCLRARHARYRLYGVPSAVMSHSLGEGGVRVLGRVVPVHSALRNYYKLRNGVWLLRQPWISNAWRVADLRRLLSLYIVCSLFVGQRFANWKMMTQGIWHGLTGRMGKADG